MTRAERRQKARAERFHRAPEKPGRRPASRPEPEVVEHIVQRVHAHPEGWGPAWKPPAARRVSAVVMGADARPGRRGGLDLGAFAVAHTAAPSTILRAGFVMPRTRPANGDIDDTQAAADDLAWPLTSHEQFARGPLRWVVWKGEATLATVDLDRVLDLLAARRTMTKDGRGFSLAFAKTTKRLGGRSSRRGVAADAHLPGVTIRALDGRRQTATFTSTADRIWHPAHLVDLIQLQHAQSGRFPRSFDDLCSGLGVAPPADGDEPGSLAARTTAIIRCYARLAERHRSLVGPYGAPDRPASPGWYGRRWPELVGLVPPLTRSWGELDPRLLGALEAYHGAEVALFHRGEPVGDCYLFDQLMQFVVGAANIGVWGWLCSERLEIVELDPGEVRERIEALGRDALTDPAVRRAFGGTFLRLIPGGDVLPHSLPAPDGDLFTKVAPLDCPEPSLWHAFDVIRSRFETGSAPMGMVEAWELRPVGRVGGLRPIELPWGRFDPDADGADLFRWSVASRVGLQAGEIDPGAVWTPEAAAAALKAGMVALVGSFAQVISETSSRPGRIVLIPGDGTPEVRKAPRSGIGGPWRLERPGDSYFPVAASAILAEARLTGYAAREAVIARGGRPRYAAVDAVIADGLSPESALGVQRELERLNPTELGGPRIVAGADGLRSYPSYRDGAAVLRITSENFGELRTDERGEAYLPRVPLTFTGWHSMRYVLTDPAGRPVRWSEHGLGELVEVVS